MTTRHQHRTLIIGHRGASHDAPENTLASFRLAFEQGADGIEADFRLSADGEIVCLHDPTTKRTAGVELAVSEATLAQLRGVDIGAWKGDGWAGSRLPTLREVVGVLPPDKLLFIELKGGPEMVAPLAEALALSQLDPWNVRLLCFSAEMIGLLKDALPGYRGCWLTDYRFRGTWRPSRRELLETLLDCGADGLASSDRAPLDAELVHALRELGLELHVWTVDRAGAARRLVDLGVDSIMTNRPGWLRQALQTPASATIAVAEEGAS